MPQFLLSLTAVALCLVGVYAAPTEIRERDAPLQWGTIGDSWDSGVAWNEDSSYDSNADKCLRLKDAYGAQMAQRQDWVTSGQSFTFAGCSGAQMENMAGVGDASQDRKPKAPAMLVMTIGGNNAGFGAIGCLPGLPLLIDLVDNCIYHGVPGRDYGKAYDKDTDGTGECKKSLAGAHNYITGTDPPHNLALDLTLTINDIMKDMAAQKVDHFTLYLTGYAHFFNVDTSDCDKWTFAPVWARNKPKLVQSFRRAFNDHVEIFNSVYQNVVRGYQMPPEVPAGAKYNLRYVSITDGFNGGRFCEKGATFSDQWASDNVLLWNLNVSPFSDTNLQIFNATDADGTVYMSGDTGTVLEGLLGQFPGGQGPFAPQSGSGEGGNELKNGKVFRAFHPKSKGHTAIANQVIAQIMADGLVPGVLGYKPDTASAAPEPSQAPVVCPSGGGVDCNDCPTGYTGCTNIGFTGYESLCNCRDPCGSVLCSHSAVKAKKLPKAGGPVSAS